MVIVLLFLFIVYSVAYGVGLITVLKGLKLIQVRRKFGERVALGYAVAGCSALNLICLSMALFAVGEKLQEAAWIIFLVTLAPSLLLLDKATRTLRQYQKKQLDVDKKTPG